MPAALYAFVTIHNSKYDSHSSTILFLKSQTSLESVKAFLKSFSFSFIFFFNLNWKKTPNKVGVLFSGFCEVCFGLHITNIINHSYTCCSQFSIELIIIQSPKHGVGDWKKWQNTATKNYFFICVHIEKSVQYVIGISSWLLPLYDFKSIAH